MPAITTPFDPSGAVDHDALAANIRRLREAGATGVVAAGCTGEFWALTEAERGAIYRSAVAATGPDGTAIVGAGAITPGAVIEALHDAAEAGADGALVLPPYFVHLSEAELIAHYETVARDAPLPIVLYNIPGNAWNQLSPAVVDILADLDAVVAIKESSGDWLNFHATLDVAKGRIRVFCGPSSTIGTAAILAGCDGLIDCFPNVWLPILHLWDDVRAGRMDLAWRVQAQAQEMTRLFTTEGRTLYPATKAAMDHLGLPGGGAPRPPLRPVDGHALIGLKQGLDAIVAPAHTAA
ncbi:dihydrodipicolinate synthase family protein [Rhodobacteraceae bacterium CCMM004]|nr:dihydrodipicolinate synthase family protein [Rhodobacteraceae bacterium CCMM004]